MILTKDGKVLTKDGKVLKSASSGGFGKAKLVATGKPIYVTGDNGEQYLGGMFQLDNPIQPNKFYYVKRFDYNYWGFYSAILETYILDGRIESSTAPMSMEENMSDFIVTGTCRIISETSLYLLPPINYTFKPSSNYENMIYIDEADYVEIYELQITFGGNE